MKKLLSKLLSMALFSLSALSMVQVGKLQGNDLDERSWFRRLWSPQKRAPFQESPRLRNLYRISGHVDILGRHHLDGPAWGDVNYADHDFWGNQSDVSNDIKIRYDHYACIDKALGRFDGRVHIGLPLAAGVCAGIAQRFLKGRQRIAMRTCAALMFGYPIAWRQNMTRKMRQFDRLQDSGLRFESYNRPSIEDSLQEAFARKALPSIASFSMVKHAPIHCTPGQFLEDLNEAGVFSKKAIELFDATQDQLRSFP